MDLYGGLTGLTAFLHYMPRLRAEELEDLPLRCQLALVHRTSPARGSIEGLVGQV